jgi:hypothetical protein
VLAPAGGERVRTLIVGRKRLPDPNGHEREWAFVAGTEQPDARPAGEAVYVIADHEGHTHLAYALDPPREPEPLQRELGIRREPSYIVTVRNPDAPAPPGAGLDERRRADLPPALRERFQGRRFIPLNPPGFLDHAGVELVLVGASEHASRELGIELLSAR